MKKDLKITIPTNLYKKISCWIADNAGEIIDVGLPLGWSSQGIERYSIEDTEEMNHYLVALAEDIMKEIYDLPECEEYRLICDRRFSNE